MDSALAIALDSVLAVGLCVSCLIGFEPLDRVLARFLGYTGVRITYSRMIGMIYKGVELIQIFGMDGQAG